jgi:hypothetical protein
MPKQPVNVPDPEPEVGPPADPVSGPDVVSTEAPTEPLPEGYRSAMDDPAHPLHHLRNAI